MGSYWSDSGLILVGLWVVIGRILDRYWLDYRCSRRNHDQRNNTFIQSKFLIKSCKEKKHEFTRQLVPIKNSLLQIQNKHTETTILVSQNSSRKFPLVRILGTQERANGTSHINVCKPVNVISCNSWQ